VTRLAQEDNSQAIADLRPILSFGVGQRRFMVEMQVGAGESAFGLTPTVCRFGAIREGSPTDRRDARLHERTDEGWAEDGMPKRRIASTMG
jgi:hypothetical protein